MNQSVIEQRQHESHGGWFYVAIVCLGIGVIVGGVVASLSNNKETTSQATVTSNLTAVASQSWDDGVMWGALAMKSMMEQKVSSEKFLTVRDVAQRLKRQFVAEQVTKQSQVGGTNGKVR